LLNADILFFSCRGVSLDGDMSDLSIEEASLRRVMFTRAKKKILLTAKEKIGKSYFYSMGNISSIDGIVCEGDLPDEISYKTAKL
jgi:DeoR/GlpR family transcriptional regulator of sugar metabolism